MAPDPARGKQSRLGKGLSALIGEVEGLAGKFFNESYGKDGEGPQTTAWNLAMETVSYKFIF